VGGPVTILGKYHQNSVILLKLRCPQPDASVNSHVLHAPFADAEVVGPIAMVRMNNEVTIHFVVRLFLFGLLMSLLTRQKCCTKKFPPPQKKMKLSFVLDRFNKERQVK
jgi:hypothetical protein